MDVVTRFDPGDPIVTRMGRRKRVIGITAQPRGLHYITIDKKGNREEFEVAVGDREWKIAPARETARVCVHRSASGHIWCSSARACGRAKLLGEFEVVIEGDRVVDVKVIDDERDDE